MNRTRFCYVDFWAGGTHSPWRRIKISEIDDKARKYKYHGVFCSVQKFESPQHIDGELCWGDLFFDLDCKENLNASKEDAKKISQYFSAMGINKEYIRIFYSGSKGFHVLITAELINISPSSELSYVMKQIALYLKEFLDLKTVDIQAYSLRRLLRLPDSSHQSTGKFKIELDIKELDLSIEEIQKLASKPRGSLYDDIEYVGIQANSDLAEWYQSFVDQYENEETLHKLKPRRIITIDPTGHPECIKFLLSRTELPVSNTGNRAVLALASYFKDTGKTEAESKDLIFKWMVNVSNCGDAGHDKKIKSMVESTVNFINNNTQDKNNDRYHFACSFIRALGSPETKIPCAYEKCPLIKDPLEQEPENPIELHLSEASKAEYKDHKLMIPVMVAGKDGAPYIVPKEIIAKCMTDKKDEKCGGCVLIDTPEYRYEFQGKDKELIEFIDTTQSEILKIIRNKLRIGSCKRCHIDFKSHCNMEVVRIVPIVDDGKYGARQHVVRVCFYLGHGINLNHKYKITAYTYTHPKDQHATHLISETEPYSTSLDNFKMTPELYKQLKVFQRKDKQSVEGKFDEIHDDLEVNVYRIWSRRQMAVGVDLVYHSIVQFSFQKQLLQKGWCECLILGDSGQGKTELMKRLRDHYNLGEGASGESAKRTGLIYNFQESQKNWMLQWGRIPLNDKGLFFIDEFSGLSPEDIAQMSHLRSTGKVVLHGIISDETNARTRLLFMSNARDGRPLNSFNHGVEAITGIMSHAEDVRRLDFALAVASGEVSLELLNRADIGKRDHIYTSYLCQNLILWAWSRQPDDVVITSDSEKLILKYAIGMSNKYSARIPLVEPADQRIKLAKLSVSTAARLFSTDDKGEKVIVYPEHVEFVHKFLEECYDHNSMSYDVFSREDKERTVIDETKEKELKVQFSQYAGSDRIKEVLMRSTYISRILLEDMLGMSKARAHDLLRFMTINNLIEGRKRGFVKTPHFVQFLKKMTMADFPYQNLAADLYDGGYKEDDNDIS